MKSPQEILITHINEANWFTEKRAIAAMEEYAKQFKDNIDGNHIVINMEKLKANSGSQMADEFNHGIDKCISVVKRILPDTA